MRINYRSLPQKTAFSTLPASPSRPASFAAANPYAPYVISVEKRRMREQDPHGRYFFEKGLCPQSKNIYLKGEKRASRSGIYERQRAVERNKFRSSGCFAPFAGDTIEV
jgi:hypothetical protein